MNAPRRLRVWLKRLSCGRVGSGRDGERVVAWLGLRPGMRIADIGSGFGDFALRFATVVGPSGVVFAVDTDADLRDEVTRSARRHGLSQLRTVAPADDDPRVPEAVDLVFLSSSFHHLPDQVAYFERVRAYLRPGGRVAILEGRPGLLTGWFGHATAPDEIVATLERAGFERLDGAEFVRWASLQTFTPTEGPGTDAPGGSGSTIAAEGGARGGP